MAQVMKDDDMLLVIIGDAAAPRVHISQEPLHDGTKIADPDVDVILDRVSKHGEYIEINPENQSQVEHLIKGWTDSDSENKSYTIKKGKCNVKGTKHIKPHKYRAANNQYQSRRNSRFYCEKCPASFRHKASLEAHENSHEGRRPYQCDSCPAAYTSDVALRRHLQTHSDSLFICDHCEAGFQFKKVLVQHMVTHQPLRRYPCEYCPRRFAQKTGLLHHQNKVHLNLPPAHACPVCPKRYARMSLVRDHMTKAHGMSMITRKMFYGSLPILSDLEVVKPAKIVF